LKKHNKNDVKVNTMDWTDYYLLLGLSVFFMSLWKTWLGPAVSVVYGFSWPEMLAWNLSGAMLSTTLTLHYSRDINALIRRLLPKRQDKPHFRKELRRYVRFWRRYGFYGVMALTPVLVGIPVGTWVSARLGTHKQSIMVMMAIFCTFWSSVLFYAASVGVEFI
jgi:hypothetical protein